MKKMTRKGAICTSEAAVLFLSVAVAGLIMSAFIGRSIKGLAGNLEAGASPGVLSVGRVAY